jgi:hypothetical protein
MIIRMNYPYYELVAVLAELGYGADSSPRDSDHR